MNDPNSTERSLALKLLGINTEAQLSSLARLAQNSNTSAEDLARHLPRQLLILCRLLESSDYLQLVQNKVRLPLAPDAIQLAREIYLEEIGELTKHPNFADASQMLMRERSDATSHVAARPTGLDQTKPFESVSGVTTIPYLLGSEPSYLPVLKFIITNDEGRVIWSDMLHWFDALFLSKTIVEQVLDHAKMSLALIESNKLMPPEGADFEKTFGQHRDALCKLEAILTKMTDPSAPPTSASSQDAAAVAD